METEGASERGAREDRDRQAEGKMCVAGDGKR